VETKERGPAHTGEVVHHSSRRISSPFYFLLYSFVLGNSLAALLDLAGWEAGLELNI
jgi:hypothetical protein